MLFTSTFSSVFLPQGIKYLIENSFLEWRAESVAEFLYKEEGLNKTAIGSFLGERYDDSLQTEAGKAERERERRCLKANSSC